MSTLDADSPRGSTDCFVVTVRSLVSGINSRLLSRQPRTNLSNSDSPSSLGGTSSVGSLDSPLSSSITPSLFHSRLKNSLFCKSFPPKHPFLPRDAMHPRYKPWPCVCLSVCLSFRPSQVGVLLKRLNVGSHKQHHTIAQGL